MISHTKNRQRENIQTQYMSIWLEENRESYIRMFFCPTCRTPIAQIAGDMVQMYPGSQEVSIGIIIECRNRNCGMKYQFHQVMKKV